MHFLICLRIHIVTVCLAEDRDHYYYGADELFRQGVCGWNAGVMLFMFTVLLEEKLLKLKPAYFIVQTDSLSIPCVCCCDYTFCTTIRMHLRIYMYVSLNMRP